MSASLTRRQMLQAGAAAGAAAFSADPLVKMAMAAKPKPLGKLSDIDHVVILIQENRSFDHYFGTYSGVEGFGDIAAKAVFEQEGYPAPGFEGKLLPFHLETKGVAQCFPDITHSWAPQHESWDGGAMDDFVGTHLSADGSQAGPATMGYYNKEDIPYYFALAEAFTLCDHYHCSVLGPTDPNRLYSVSGTIDPNGEAGGPIVSTLGLTERTKAEGTFKWATMPEQLSSAGVSWKMYNGAGQGVLDNPLVYFENFHSNAELKAKAFKPVYPTDFKTDLEKGELPQVSWVNISVTESEHPGFSTAKTGERATAELLKLLLKSKTTWAKTALFVTWDENGGFFDHVAPPTAPMGTPGEYLTVPDISNDSGGIDGPIGLGFRVPMIVASPFTRGGLVSSVTYDHTSTLRFLETRFGVEVPNLSEWRRQNTGDLTEAFNFAVAPEAKKPKLPKVHLAKAEKEQGGCSTKAPVSVPPNSYPTQEAGTRGTPSGVV
ncbi:MAG TPA: alkaline phosphatase family protein [Solirubrobacteraceae bacterium]